MRLFCVHVSFTPAWLHFLHLWIPKWQRAVDTQAEEMVPLSLQLLRIYDMLTMYLHISRQGWCGFPQDFIVQKVEPQTWLQPMYSLEQVEWSEHHSVSITRPACSCSTETVVWWLFLNKPSLLHRANGGINLNISQFWDNQSSSPLMDSGKIRTACSVSFIYSKEYFFLCV